MEKAITFINISIEIRKSTVIVFEIYVNLPCIYDPCKYILFKKMINT